MAGAKRQSRYESLTRGFRERILRQDWPPGFQLPSETDLAAEHGVSRMTMNKVLGTLTREGFLIRKRRSGTFVAQPRAQSAVMEINDIAAEVAALGLAYGYELIERKRRPLTPEEAQFLPVGAADAEVLALEGLHRASTAPFCHEARVIHLAAAPAALEEDFTRLPPGEWLRREIPWTSAQHVIRAVPASAQVARHLGLVLGAPCLEITRQTEINGKWVTLVRQSYAGERHQVVSRFTPQGAR